MADLSRLKKKGAEFEAKRQYDRAIATYEQVIAESSTQAREVDVPLFNRLGDLHLRMGNLDRAVVLYEKAVDLYAELGFFDNAIALCNKILRQTPNRSSIYYKLGKISAKKGFTSDAKQNFLEYAARMQRGGKLDEAFRSLKEFADLCPGQDDVRLMLAEQLNRVGRKTDALEQLQVLHQQLDAEGRESEATAAVERMRMIDPAAKPRTATGPAERRTDDLVFLDLSDQPAAKSALLEGLDPTSLAEQVHSPLRPLTPQEFAAVELPAPAKEQTAVAQPDLADLPLLDTESKPAPVSRMTPRKGYAALPEILPPPETPPPAQPKSPKSPKPPKAPASAEPAAEPARAEEAPAEPRAKEPSGRAASTKQQPEHARPGAPDEEFIDLGDWLRADETPRTTRMVTDAEAPPEGEQADFDEMLTKFKDAVALNVDAEDYGSHYDLGVAFKEMGLLDEAIAEFQKAVRGPEYRVAAAEALGQCFVDKRQYEVAVTLLQRAIREPDFKDEHGLGVLYLLGFAHEARKRKTDAVEYYQRVFAVDIRFRDIADRLKAVTTRPTPTKRAR